MSDSCIVGFEYGVPGRYHYVDACQMTSTMSKAFPGQTLDSITVNRLADVLFGNCQP
jgi:hypothetical protein